MVSIIISTALDWFPISGTKDQSTVRLEENTMAGIVDQHENVPILSMQVLFNVVEVD
jgi:hypothetical protein